MDPDDLIRAKGKIAMQDVLDSAIPLVDMLWHREVQAEPLNTPEEKAGLKSRIFNALNEIAHEDVKAQYRTALLDRFDTEFGRARKTGGQSWHKNKRKASPALKNQMKAEAMETARERRLIGAILEWPELLPRIDQQFFELQFRSRDCADMQVALLNYWRNTNTIEKAALKSHIARDGLENSLRDFSRDRLLIKAAMGGSDAELDERVALWQDEADALTGQIQETFGDDDTQSRMAESIRTDNSDALKRLMRASREARD